MVRLAFRCGLLVVGGRHRLRDVVFLALVIAAMVYAGQAEILVLVGLALAVFLVCLLVQRAPALRGQGPIRRPVFDLSLGVLCGAGLGAPLLLPGLQVVSGSQHSVPGGDPAEILKGNPPLPAHNLVHVLFQGFDGLPVAGSHWFGYVGGYSETAAYVGVTALVLAVTGLAVRRRPEVVAFGALCVAMLVVAFFPPLVALLYRLPMWARSCGSAPLCRSSSASPCWVRSGWTPLCSPAVNGLSAGLQVASPWSPCWLRRCGRSAEVTSRLILRTSGRKAFGGPSQRSCSASPSWACWRGPGGRGVAEPQSVGRPPTPKR